MCKTNFKLFDLKRTPKHKDEQINNIKSKLKNVKK